jgi:hypothetical protein
MLPRAAQKALRKSGRLPFGRSLPLPLRRVPPCNAGFGIVETGPMSRSFGKATRSSAANSVARTYADVCERL